VRPLERYLVFTAQSDEARPEAPLPSGYRVELWRPSWAHPAPPGERAARLYVCWLMHETQCFRNREYGALIIRAGQHVAHRALVLPPYFVFPFMDPGDLQIGYTATNETHRGRGLATFAIREIVGRFGRPGRRFWYLTEESNAASVRAAKRAGLSLVAEGIRKDRLRVRALGYFALTAAAEHP
jgi:RimJ/RimL family protein N-acetyltransferase